MAFTFPTDKADFTAPNGITYSWDTTDEKWVVKSYKAEDPDIRLPYRIETEPFGDPQIQLVDAQDNFTNVKFVGNAVEITSGPDSITIDGSELKNTTISLQNQIDDLGITKGALATYQCAAVTLPYNARNGECAFNDATASSAIVVGFGAEDKDGQLTKPILNGDIIEIDRAGIVSRYKVLDNASAPSMVACEFVSGDQTFAIGQEYVVYIYPQNEAGASKEYVDAQDALLQDQIDDKINADDVNGKYLEIAGGTIDGELQFSGGDDTNNLSIYPNRGNDDSTITALNGSALRFRTVATGGHNDTGKKTHFSIETNDLGEPVTHVYHLAAATEPDQPATLAQLEGEIAKIDTGGGVPTGCIMIWMNSTAPAGWFKLQGGTFDVNANPQLHAYLQGTAGYTSGRLPDWSGRFPGEYGDHALGSLGTKLDQRTAKPSGGSPKSSGNHQNGSTDTANQAGGHSFAAAAYSKVTISDGWDSVTRPPTVVVHYIIKGG